MFDYKGLQALAAVVDQQGFESAAEKLYITQSAISQRIKTMESYFGVPLLIREHPYQPTELGQQLLNHYRKTKLLEDEARTLFSNIIEHPKITIAINRDSLEIWFPHVFKRMKELSHMTLEVITDDQEVTLDYFKKGLVSACLSTSDKAISGCNVEFLGYMDYVLVATKAFQKKHFDDHHHKKNLINAQAIIFDVKDALHARYLERFFHIFDAAPTYHIVPSVHAFKQFALMGYGYGLIPKIDIKKELAKKQLVELFPDKPWRMPLYWHSWQIQTKQYQAFNDLVLKVAHQHLDQQ